MPSRERHHRRSTQISPSEINRVHHHISRAFSGEIPASRKRNASIDSDYEEALYSSSPSSSSTRSSSSSSRDPETPRYQKQSNTKTFFPSNIGTPSRRYSRAMHDYHATSQPNSPRASIEKKQESSIETETPFRSFPNYTKTMHAFTLNQLNHLNNTGSHNRANANANNKPTAPLKGSQLSPPSATPTPTTPKIQPVPTSNPTSPILPITSPLALKLPPSQSRTQYLSRSLSLLNQMSLDEAPCGPSNTPEPGDLGGLGRPPLPRTPTSLSASEDESMDDDIDSRSEGTLSPMEMSPSEMLAQGRELEARFQALIRMGDADVRDHGRGDGIDGLEFGSSSSEARDFARFRMVL